MASQSDPSSENDDRLAELNKLLHDQHQRLFVIADRWANLGEDIEDAEKEYMVTRFNLDLAHRLLAKCESSVDKSVFDNHEQSPDFLIKLDAAKNTVDKRNDEFMHIKTHLDDLKEEKIRTLQQRDACIVEIERSKKLLGSLKTCSQTQ